MEVQEVEQAIARMEKEAMYLDVDTRPVPRTAINSLHLVCFLASVVRDVRRLEHLKSMLESVRNQRIPLTGGLFVSIYVDPILGLSRANVRALFNGIPHLHIFLQKRPKLQFMQFYEMFTRLNAVFPCPNGKALYIMFSDDDDLWHPQRTHYYHALHTGSSKRDNVTGLCLVEYAKTNNIACSTRHNNDVDSMIACGCVKFEHKHGGEYHQLAVKPIVLQDFFIKFLELCKRNRYADMEFRNFAFSYGGKQNMTVFGIPGTWAYYYRHCDSSYACNSYPQIDFDPTRELDIIRDLPALRLMVQHVIDLEECTATKNIAEKQFCQYADVVTGGNKEKLLIFMALYGTMKNKL
jgi:hypothetical protein